MGYVACITKVRSACKGFVKKLKGLDHLKVLGIDIKEIGFYLLSVFHVFAVILTEHFIFCLQDVDGNYFPG
jgi:hypothetical protein